MPSAALQYCTEAGCTARVPSGRCPQHRRATEQRRGSASSRGYGSQWENFRSQFVQMLLDAGIPPVCGASLPSGPQTQDSRCKSEGLITSHGLHLDHEPPLTNAERINTDAVCNPNRVQLLCAADHSLKTKRERRGEMLPALRVQRYVVTGPPGSGKSTWVQQRRRKGDLVFDMDVLAATVAQYPDFPRPPYIVEAMVAIRNSLVTLLTYDHKLSCLIIVTDSTDARRLSSLVRAELVKMG